MDSGNNTLSEMLNKLTTSLESEFNGKLNSFQDIRSYIYPDSGDALVGEYDRPEFKELYKNILDLVTIDCVDTLAAGMESGMVSPFKEWMKLKFKLPEIMVDYESKKWLDSVSEIMMDAFRDHDFYQAVLGRLRDAGLYGTAAMLIEEVEDEIVFQAVPMGEFFLGSDSNGKADTFARKLYMTARQIVQRYGLTDKLPKAVVEAYHNQDHNQRFVVWHIIMPRREAFQSLQGRYAARLGKEMPWASYHYLEISKENQTGEDANVILYEGGYEEQPFSAPRWQREGRRTYGVGCGHKALAACKRLRREVWEYMLNLALNNNPPTKSPGTNPLQLDMSPGGVNPTQSNKPDEVTPLFIPKIDINAVLGDIVDVRTQIQNAFHYKTFVLLRDIDKEMTIPELRQLQSEQMTMLAPYMTQISRELLDPIINRVFGILLRAEAFPPPPQHMGGVKIEVGYVGELAKRQKAADLIPIEQTLALAERIAQYAPQIMDKFNFDKITDRLADSNGMDVSLMNEDSVVEEIRQARSKKESAAELGAAAQQGAAIAKDLGSAGVAEMMEGANSA